MSSITWNTASGSSDKSSLDPAKIGRQVFFSREASSKSSSTSASFKPSSVSVSFIGNASYKYSMPSFNVAVDFVIPESLASAISVASDKESQILDALKDERYAFRTVDGISKELDIPEDDVSAFLNSSPLVRQSWALSKSSRVLYTHKQRGISGKELLAVLRFILTKQY